MPVPASDTQDLPSAFRESAKETLDRSFQRTRDVSREPPRPPPPQNTRHLSPRTPLSRQTTLQHRTENRKRGRRGRRAWVSWPAANSPTRARSAAPTRRSAPASNYSISIWQTYLNFERERERESGWRLASHRSLFQNLQLVRIGLGKRCRDAGEKRKTKNRKSRETPPRRRRAQPAVS